LAARRGLEPRGDLAHALVVVVEARDRIARARRAWLLLDAHGATLGVELHHAVAFRILHRIGEHRRARSGSGGALERGREVMSVEDVVAEDEAARSRAHELAS